MITGLIFSVALSIAILRILTLHARLKAITRGFQPALNLAFQHGRQYERALVNQPARPIDVRESEAYERGVKDGTVAAAMRLGVEKVNNGGPNQS